MFEVQNDEDWNQEDHSRRGTGMWECFLTWRFRTRTRNFENTCICGRAKISWGSVLLEKFGEVRRSSEYMKAFFWKFILYHPKKHNIKWLVMFPKNWFCLFLCILLLLFVVIWCLSYIKNQSVRCIQPSNLAGRSPGRSLHHRSVNLI